MGADPYLLFNREFSEKLEKIEEHPGVHDEQFRVVFDAVRQLLQEDGKSKRKIGF